MEQYSILAKALDDVMTEELNEYLAAVDFSVEHRFSEKFERRMERLIKRREKPYYKLICTAGRRAVCIAAAVVIAFGFAMSFESVRAAVKEFFTKVFSDHITLEVYPEFAENDPDTIEEVYEITELPEGFELVDSGIYTTCAYADYVFEDYHISFLQETKRRFHVALDNEYSESEVFVNETGQEYRIQFHQDGNIRIIWDKDGYLFSIDSNLNRETVLDLCMSTKKKDS